MIVDMTRKVHEQMTKETWYKGSFGYAKGYIPYGETFNPSGYCSLCAFGWLYIRYGKKKVYDLVGRVNRVIKEKCQLSLVTFNDSPSTTFEDVLQVLREADL